MVPLCALVLLSLVAGSSAQCPTIQGHTCKADHPYNSYYGANPCFANGGDQVCFYSDAAIVDKCDCCKSACNCQSSAKNCISCDNSAIGATPDCSADKTTYCAFGQDNSMCQYCGVNVGQCGQKVCTIGLASDAEKKELTDKHNELRAKVARGEEGLGVKGGQPKAANMNKLAWDDEVARVAQRWADQCSPTPHDTNRKQPGFSDAYGCGQNVYYSWNSERSTKKGLAKAVQAWYDEVKDFDKADVTKYGTGQHTGVTGHYTAVVWGDATLVGCGYVYRVDPSNGMYQEIVVCNYCKGGNMMGDPMYTIGEAASKCPADRPNNENGLCAP